MPLLINDVPISCINHAAVAYHVPAPIILSIIRLENGRNGDARHNRNGTTDYGVLQINSVWLEKLGKHGYTRQDLRFNPCRNVEAAAWILSQQMAKNLPVWTAIARYHSMTPERNRRYALKARKVFTSLEV